MYPNFNNPNQPGPGYPGNFNNPTNPGYPPSGSMGFPSADMGYPGGSMPGTGFPSPMPGDFNNNSGPKPSYPSYPGNNFPGSSGDYPGQAGGYPGQAGGYPPNNNNNNSSGGYPGQGGNFPSGGGGYPPSNDNSTGGYPGQGGGYPGSNNSNSGGGGYPGQAGGYPGSAGGYPGNTGGSLPVSDYPNFSQNPSLNYPNDSQQHQPQFTPSNYPANGTGGASLYPNIAVAPSNTMVQHDSSYDSPPQQNMHYDATVRPYQPFNPNDDATKLYKAMKGFGTNEAALIDVLCKRTAAQRQDIAISFKSGYGKDLYKNVMDETGGNFQLLMKCLLMPTSHLEAHDLKQAIDGLGTEEITLIDILCTKTNSEMKELKQAFQQLYRKDIEREVGGDVSGYFKRILVSLSAANRSEQGADHQRAVQQAHELYKAGAKKLGTDEVTFNRIFAVESFPHLKVVFDEYYKIAKHSIESAIKSEMSGDVEQAFLAITQAARNPPAYWAQRLYESMHGAGTKDRILIRIMVLRSEKDMVQIKQEFQRMYGKSLESFIKSDTSGDYKKGLLCLAGC